MADNSNGRKKTLVVSVLAFLFVGGGVFLFFIIQGSDDLTSKGKKNNFAYGFSVREAVLPLFKRLGLSTYEDEIAEASKKRLEARGVELAPDSAAPADVSDWMANNSAGAPSASGSSYSGRPTSVPKMSAGAGSPVGGGAGGTKSQGGVSRFGEGNSAGNTTVSSKGQAGGGGPAGKGTMVTLKNARALLGEGLRSDSAMTARSKWGQSFGVGGSGGKSGDLAYNKTGLVNLDRIKSGEIANLKMDSKGSLKTTEVGSPVKDNEGTSKALAADKNTKEDMEAKLKADAIKAAAETATQAATKPDKPDGPTTLETPPSNQNRPPDNVLALGQNQKPPPEGKYCPDGCATSDGKGTYKDNEARFQPPGRAGDPWTVTYSGVQTMPDGTTFEYSDTMSIDPGRNPPMQLVDVVEGPVKK